jgi:hypothetical protein
MNSTFITVAMDHTKQVSSRYDLQYNTYVTSYFVNTMKRSTHPVVIDLKRIQLQLTAYSVRWGVSCLWHDRLEL